MSEKSRLQTETFLFPLLSLAVAILSFALLINKLGFYWDDWPMNWIGSVLGPDALRQYFSTNRPYIGEINIFLLRVLGSKPLPWHLFTLLLQWFNCLVLWLTLRRLMPAWTWLAALISLLFMVYPGPVQHYIAFVYSPFYLMLLALLLSFYCSVRAVQSSSGKVGWTMAALVLAAINMFSLDYYFMLELLRLFFLLMALWIAPREGRLTKRLFMAYVPYLALFLLMVFWRAFLFPYQTQNYDPVWLEQLRANPLAGLGLLVQTVFDGLMKALIKVWQPVLAIGSPEVIGKRIFAMTLGVALAIALVCALFIRLVRKSSASSGNDKTAASLGWLLLTGFAGLLLAGLPFWMIDLPVNLGFPNSRALMPFTLGASLLTGSLIGLLSFSRWVRGTLLIVLIAMAGSWQYRVAETYRRDWALQSSLFWQLSWRAPAIQPNTTLLFNELPVSYPTDNSLTATLNWIYARADGTQGMPYLFYYPSLRLGSGLPKLEPGLPVRQDYLGAVFEGTTDQLLALTFEPPACLHLLDPLTSQPNIMVPQQLRQAAKIANLKTVLTENPVTPEALFGEEPAHGWCYYYQKADLARQLGDWETIAELGEAAFSLNDHPNDPMERLPFIEGYAMAGDLERAIVLSDETLAVTEVMRPVVCQLWDRIAEQAEHTSESSQQISDYRQGLGCQ